MEIIKWYCCPVCGEHYRTEEEQKECEDKHHFPEEIVSALFTKGFSFPTEIVIKAKDGRTAVYDFMQDIT